MPPQIRGLQPSRTTLLSALLAGALVMGATGAFAQSDEGTELYEGTVEVIRGPQDPGLDATADDDTLRGRVFLDSDQDSSSRDEDGVEGIMVSNGREVVVTDEDGSYELPAYENMTVFVTKPAGYDVPVDEDNLPQFYYHHLPDGSPPLRFGGLPPTGPLPDAVNFPVVASDSVEEFSCALVGDSQTYSNREIGYLRDGVVEDVAEREGLAECGALLLGDLMGDDLGLYDRYKDVWSLADIPIRAVPGNHDIDFDADTDEHSFDTYRREIGPAYYSYDVGNVHFVGLDNVRYPCTSAELDFCGDPEHPTYNGVIGEEQMAWLEADLANVPEDKLVVIATHIPMVSYIDMNADKHQTDDVNELYALLEGRPALSVSGHTHTLENLATGESFEGWQQTVGVDELPFPHIVAGAASGSWWGGDLDADGIPMAFAREGTPGGWMQFDFDGSEFDSTFYATAFGDDMHMAVSLNSPHFRDWAEQLRTFREEAGDDDVPPSEETPPVNINDLGDPNLVTDEDLAEATWLVANYWNGSADTTVTAQINDGEQMMMERTQDGDGEGILEGLPYADPFAMTRQLQVARTAFVSESGDERAQGYERFRGSQFGPADPRPEDEGTDQSVHLWRLPLPADLPEGAHTATVRATDADGATYEEVLGFEVSDDRPAQFFRTEVFEDDQG